jgi:hypothetical protein
MKLKTGMKLKQVETMGDRPKPQDQWYHMGSRYALLKVGYICNCARALHRPTPHPHQAAPGQ